MTDHDDAYWARKEQERMNAERAAARKAEDERRMTHAKATESERKAARKITRGGGLSKSQAACLEVLRAAGENGLTGTELHKLMEKRTGRVDVSWSVFRSRLTELERHGLATKTTTMRANHRSNEEVVWRALEPWEFKK